MFSAILDKQSRKQVNQLFYVDNIPVVQTASIRAHKNKFYLSHSAEGETTHNSTDMRKTFLNKRYPNSMLNMDDFNTLHED